MKPMRLTQVIRYEENLSTWKSRKTSWRKNL